MELNPNNSLNMICYFQLYVKDIQFNVAQHSETNERILFSCYAKNS